MYRHGHNVSQGNSTGEGETLRIGGITLHCSQGEVRGMSTRTRKRVQGVQRRPGARHGYGALYPCSLTALAGHAVVAVILLSMRMRCTAA